MLFGRGRNSVGLNSPPWWQAAIPPHEDECIRRRSRKTADVSDSMTWGAQQVEGAITEIVEGRASPNFQ